MWFTRGLQCNFSGVSSCRLILVVVCSLFVMNITVSVDAKHLDHHRYGGGQHHLIHRRAVADDNEGGGDTKTCESVKHFFDAMNVTIYPRFDSTGKFNIGTYFLFGVTGYGFDLAKESLHNFYETNFTTMIRIIFCDAMRRSSSWYIQILDYEKKFAVMF